MGATDILARYVVETGYDSLPKEAVELAKSYIFDCVGHMIGGSGEQVTQRLMRYVQACGGVPEAGVVGGAFKTTVANASWVNGAAAHALELEAAGRFPGSNYCSLIPAALAVGEMVKASGRSVIEAFVLGVEIQGRFGAGTVGLSNRGWIGFVHSVIGIVALTAKLLNFNADQVKTAFGLGLPYCGGFRRSTGSMAHLLDCGTSSWDGVTAALLAREGITSCLDIVEGPEGFGEVYCKGGLGGYDLDVMTKGFGDPFYIISPGTSRKVYGCCVQNDRALDALFKLIEEHDIYYDQVERVEVETPPHTGKMLRFHDPRNGEQAKFSLRHSLGAALLERKPTLPWTRPFTDAAAVDPKYVEARDKIDWKIREDLPMTRVHEGEQKVTVKLKDGRVLTSAVDAVSQKGSRTADLSPEECMTVFKYCANGRLSDPQVKRISELIFSLEELQDVREIAELMTNAKP